MALFRNTHNDDIVQNWFWELPDHYWIGTMLINKHTMLPVSGYDTPLAKIAPIPPRPLWWGYESGSFGQINYYIYNLGATYGPTDYYNTYWGNTYNYGQYNRPFATAMCLGQCGFMCLGLFPVRYIAESNNVDEFPKSYIPDPEDEDIVYVQMVGSSVGDASYLIKYNIKTHKVIWSSRNFGSFAFARMKIFAIESGYLYILGNVANPAGYNKQEFVYNKYGTSGDSVVRFYQNCDTVPYHFRAGWYIAKVSAEDGSFDIISVVNPSLNFGDGGDCQYMGRSDDGKDLFLLFYTNSSTNFTAKFISPTEIDYRQVRRSSIYYSYSTRYSRYFFGVANTSAYLSNWYSGYSTVTNDRYQYQYQTVYMTQQVGYLTYDRTSHSISTVPGGNLTTPTKWADPGTTFYLYNVPYNPKYISSKQSRPDRTIENAIVCYGHWGRLLRPDYQPDGTFASDVRQIWKHTYQNGVQSHEQMMVLNKDGQEMVKTDWGTMNQGRTSKFYVLYGENKKFLMVHDSYLFAGPGAPYDNTDTYAKTFVFEFVDDNTLQLVFEMNLNCTDLLWIKHNWFVAARRNRIRTYSVDLETGAINLERNVNTKAASNYFSYIHVDDMRNVWFAEIGKDTNQPSQIGMCLYFVNSYTVAKLSMTPEKYLYTYEGSSIETYIKISAIGDYNDLIERDVKLVAVGPLVFKDTGTKSITTTTQTGGEQIIKVILTGVGEASITMTLV